MLVNLRNHPFTLWSAEQKEAAGVLFGTVVDLPFPQIEPGADIETVLMLAEAYMVKCMEILQQEKGTDQIRGVHIMGEMTFTYNLVNKLKEAGIMAVASTTNREVETDKEGNRVSGFNFIRFREYYIVNNI